MAALRNDCLYAIEGYLPHLQAQQAIYFVIFRLADSLPKKLDLQFREQGKTPKRVRLTGTTNPAGLVPLRELRTLEAMTHTHRCAILNSYAFLGGSYCID